MILLLAVSLITAFYIILGSAGMRRLNKERSELPKQKAYPLVTILIPAYNSQGIIEAAIKSAKSLDYRRKEVIVVNDSMDRTSEIARRLGVRVVQNRTRMGKPAALNKALSMARGSLIFVLDADTTLDRSSLKRMVPWFSKPEVAAVMPTYRLANPGRVSNLANVENLFTFALIRVHMLFGSLVGFRGCSVLVRRDVLRRFPWPCTILEDNHMAATLSRNGMRIIWEPLAYSFTSEPNTMSEVSRQKRRWGQGAYFAFRHHARFYMRSPQFMIFFYPYFALGIATGLLAAAFLFSPILVPWAAAPIAWELLGLFVGMYFHTMILLWIGGGGFLPARTLTFMIAYFPVMTYHYFTGIVKGIRCKRAGRKELDFSHW